VKILILGAGQVGRTAAQHLSREEANEVTVVDINEELLRDLQDRLDVRTVAGNAAYPSVLESAGAAEAEVLVALTSSDEVNMMACEVAFTLFRTPTKIARIRAAEYTSRAALFGGDGLSVDVCISPGRLVTGYVERLIHDPGTRQVLDFAGGRVRLVGVRARRGGLLELLLAIQMIIRVGLLDALIVLAPAGLLCYAWPRLQGMAELWGRLFIATLITQFVQIAALHLGEDLVTDAPATFITSLNPTTLPLSMVKMTVQDLVAIAVFVVVLRVPKILRGQGHGPSLGSVLLAVKAAKVAGVV